MFPNLQWETRFISGKGAWLKFQLRNKFYQYEILKTTPHQSSSVYKMWLLTLMLITREWKRNSYFRAFILFFYFHLHFPDSIGFFLSTIPKLLITHLSRNSLRWFAWMILQRKTTHTCRSQSSVTYSQKNFFSFWPHPPNNCAISWCGTKETAGTQKERTHSPHILPGAWSKPATCRHRRRRHCCCCRSSSSLEVWPQVPHRRVSTLPEIPYKVKLSRKTAGFLGRFLIGFLINHGDVYPSDQSSTDTAGVNHGHGGIWFQRRWVFLKIQGFWIVYLRGYNLTFALPPCLLMNSISCSSGSLPNSHPVQQGAQCDNYFSRPERST